MQLESNLEIVLEKWKKRMRDRRIAEPMGYDDATISLKERYTAKPFPREIRRLYETFTAETWELATGPNPHFRLQPVWDASWEKSRVLDRSGEDDDAPPRPNEPDWLIFGTSLGFELLIWCEHFPPNFSGAILGFYMEDADPPLVFGESLGKWLDRLLKYDGQEYGLNLLTLLKSQHTPFEKELFISDHLRLNPADAISVQRWKRLHEKQG